MAVVALDESAHTRGVTVRVPHLDPDRAYDLAWAGPEVERPVGHRHPKFELNPGGPSGGIALPGAVLGNSGVWVPRRQPQTVTLIHVQAG